MRTQKEGELKQIEICTRYMIWRSWEKASANANVRVLLRYLCRRFCATDTSTHLVVLHVVDYHMLVRAHSSAVTKSCHSFSRQMVTRRNKCPWVKDKAHAGLQRRDNGNNNNNKTHGGISIVCCIIPVPACRGLAARLEEPCDTGPRQSPRTP